MNNRNGTGTMDPSQEKIGEKLDERIDSIKEQVKGLVDKGEQRAAALKNRAIEVKDEAFSKGNAYLDQIHMARAVADEADPFFRFGDASVMAVFVFVALMAVTLLQWRIFRKPIEY